MSITKSLPPRGSALSLIVCCIFSVSLHAQAPHGPVVRRDVHHDVSLPLLDMIRSAPAAKREPHEAEPRRNLPLPQGLRALPEDPVRQESVTGRSPQVGLQFEGVGNEQYGYYVMWAPPDTNGAVGESQYVQWVNSAFAIFDKQTGALLAGPTDGNVLWSSFGGGCQNNNDGDPIVVYDKLASRWVMSQFSVSSAPYLQCVAVSMTSDATGRWYRYAFQYNYFDDYPKMGVWPDGYYETFNMFNGNTFMGADVCAYNRAAMLNGQAATQICFQQSAAVGGLLPSDVDGTLAPPAGSPNYMLTYGANSLELYKFHVDFNTPSNSTFTGPASIPVAAFSPLCMGGSSCVPQPGTTTRLDSLADRLMHRLAYRRFADHESLVVTHSVAANGAGGIRWYEIRSPNSNPVVAQQGTFAPDSNYRWMGSIAMDRVGDMAVGYSIASSAVHPSIAFAGRVPSDPAGVLQTETTVITGGGSQTPNLSRWGDYSSMTVDPTDDCTFWYTTEYLQANGAWNWHTRIANFKFSGCVNGGYIGFYPDTLSFANQTVGTTSAAQQITFSNHLAVTLHIAGIVATGDFQQSNNCGASLAPNGSCTINVNFHPTTPGIRTGTLSISDDGPGSPRVATLSGVGIQTATCAANALSNAGFESGTLDCWSFGGAIAPTISTQQAHGGSFSAQLGATGLPEPLGDSWIYQTITVPDNMENPTLTFWYWPWSDDIIEYDWQEAQIQSAAGAMLAQIFKVASNSQSWTRVVYDLTAYKGQTIRLYFNAHEDGYIDQTYMYVDDIAITDGDPGLMGLRFVPVTPCRVVDTRRSSGTFGGPSIAGGTSRDFPVPQGGCGIPASAAAYALNVTVVPHGRLDYLTAWPTGSGRPVVSTLNSYDGRVKANAAVVPAGSSLAISVYVTNTTDVILDINGFFVPASDSSALAFFPLAPCRVLDTRAPNGALGGPRLLNGVARQFPVLQASACNIPASAQAYSLNFAALPRNGRGLGYLTVWPAGHTMPLVSTLNGPTGTVVANAAIVPAGTNGDIVTYAYGNDTDLIADINGYFAPADSAPGPMSLYSVTPCRVLDTRDPQQGHLFQGEFTVSMQNCSLPGLREHQAPSVPAAPTGYVVNATVVPPHAMGYLTLWPDGQQQPVVSTLNAYDGAVTSNMAVVPTTNGAIDAFAYNWTHLLVDVFAYFAP